MKEQNLYGDNWNLKVLHNIPSESIDMELCIDNELEDQYNIRYIIAEFIDAVSSLDVLMGKNTLPPLLSTQHSRSRSSHEVSTGRSISSP